MTGQLLTSFKNSVAMGSYQATATTIPNLINELRYSSGCAGSFSLGTAYTLSGVTIPTGWYNFLYIPHRSGGINGQANGDNTDYGSLLLSGMTVSGCYIVRYSSSSIAEVRNVYQDNNSTYPDAIKNITRSGTTFTATRYSGSTFTFTQQDNNTNTTYSFTTLQASGSFSGSGWKKLTKAIPSGYTAFGGLYQPVDIYASGHEMANITDRNCTVSGSTLTINFYLYNPANVNLNVVASCLFFKTN